MQNHQMKKLMRAKLLDKNNSERSHKDRPITRTIPRMLVLASLRKNNKRKRKKSKKPRIRAEKYSLEEESQPLEEEMLGRSSLEMITISKASMI